METSVRLSPETIKNDPFFTPDRLVTVAVDNSLNDKSHQTFAADYSEKHGLYRINYNLYSRVPETPLDKMLPGDFVEAVQTKTRDAQLYASHAYQGFLGQVKDNKYVHREIYTDREFHPSTSYNLFVEKDSHRPVYESFTSTNVKMGAKYTYEDMKDRKIASRADAELHIVQDVITSHVAHINPYKVKKSPVLHFTEIGTQITEMVQLKASEFAIENDLGCIHRRRRGSTKVHEGYDFLATSEIPSSKPGPHPLHVQMTRTKEDVCAINSFIFGHYLRTNEKPFSNDVTEALAEMVQRDYNAGNPKNQKAQNKPHGFAR